MLEVGAFVLELLELDSEPLQDLFVLNYGGVHLEDAFLFLGEFLLQVAGLVEGSSRYASVAR